MLNKTKLKRALLRVASQVKSEVARKKLYKLAGYAKKVQLGVTAVDNTAPTDLAGTADFTNAYVHAYALNMAFLPAISSQEVQATHFPAPSQLKMVSKSAVGSFLKMFGLPENAFDGNLQNIRKEAWKVEAKSNGAVKQAMTGTGLYFINYTNTDTAEINREITNDLFDKMGFASSKITKEILDDFSRWMKSDANVQSAVYGPVQGGRYGFISDHPEYQKNQKEWMKKIRLMIEDAVLKVLPQSLKDIKIDVHAVSVKESTAKLLSEENVERAKNGEVPLDVTNKKNLKYLIELGKGTDRTVNFLDPVTNKQILVTTQELYYLSEDISYKLEAPEFHPTQKISTLLNVLYNPNERNVDQTRIRILRQAYGSEGNASLGLGKIKANPLYAPKSKNSPCGIRINNMVDDYTKAVKDTFAHVNFIPLQVKRSTGNNVLDLPFSMDLTEQEFKDACLASCLLPFKNAIKKLALDAKDLFEFFHKSVLASRASFNDPAQGDTLSTGDLQELVYGQRGITSFVQDFSKPVYPKFLADKSSPQYKEEALGGTYVTKWEDTGVLAQKGVKYQPNNVSMDGPFSLENLPIAISKSLQEALQKLVLSKRKPWDDAHNMVVDTNVEAKEVEFIQDGQVVKGTELVKFSVEELRAQRNADWVEILLRESGMTVTGQYKDDVKGFLDYMTNVICNDYVATCIGDNIYSEYYNKEKQDLARKLLTEAKPESHPLTLALDPDTTKKKSKGGEEKATGVYLPTDDSKALISLLQTSDLNAEQLLLLESMIEEGALAEEDTLEKLLQKTIKHESLLDVLKRYDYKIIDYLQKGAHAVDLPDNLLYHLLSTCLSVHSQHTAYFFLLLYASPAKGNNLTIGILHYLIQTLFQGIPYYANSTGQHSIVKEGYESAIETYNLDTLRDLSLLVASVSSKTEQRTTTTFPEYDATTHSQLKLPPRNPVLYMPLGTKALNSDYGKPATDAQGRFRVPQAKFDSHHEHNLKITKGIMKALKSIGFDLTGLDLTDIDAFYASLETLGVGINKPSSSYYAGGVSALKTALKTVVGSLLNYGSKLAPLQQIADYSRSASEAMQSYSDYLYNTLKVLQAESATMNSRLAQLDVGVKKSLAEVASSQQEIDNYNMYVAKLPLLKQKVQDLIKQHEQTNVERAAKGMAPLKLKIKEDLAAVEKAEKFIKVIEDKMTGTDLGALKKGLNKIYKGIQSDLQNISDQILAIGSQIKKITDITQKAPRELKTINQDGSISNASVIALRTGDPFLKTLSNSEFTIFLDVLHNVLFKSMSVKKDQTLIELGYGIRKFNESTVQDLEELKSEIIPDFESKAETFEDYEEEMIEQLNSISAKLFDFVVGLRDLTQKDGLGIDESTEAMTKQASVNSYMQKAATILQSIELFNKGRLTKLASQNTVALRWNMFKAIKKASKELGL